MKRDIKKTQTSETYDDMYAQGGHENVYELNYRDSCYYPLFKKVIHEIQRKNLHSVLEVGCGNGALAQMISEKYHNILYSGFDFSSVAVKKAKIRLGYNADRVSCADATNDDSYVRSTKFDSIICLEVLEHIPNDLEVISKWPKGKICICSVPNFDSAYHERFFQREYEVRDRYADLLDIEKITRVKKPAIANISWRNKLQAIIWYRYKPRMLAHVCGLTTFKQSGGWFLFVGTTK